jgi:hypothetical protein
MVKKTIPKSDDKDLSPKQKEFLTSLFNSENGILSKPNNPQASGLNNMDDVKQLEAIKLILGMIGNKDFIKSATNLPEDEMDDLNDALMLNEYADCPELDNWIKNRLELARSRISNGTNYSNVLKLLSDISGKTGLSLGDMQQENTILGKLRSGR